MQRRHLHVIGNGKEQRVLDAERLGEFVAQDFVDRAAGSAPDDLGGQVAVGPTLIAGRRARLPFGSAIGQQLSHRVLVDQGVHGDVRRQEGQAAGVAQYVPDGDLFLAVLGEFGPILGDRGVVAEFAALDQKRGENGGGALAHRVAVNQRVRVDTGRDVDREFPVDVGRHLQADFVPRRDGRVQRRRCSSDRFRFCAQDLPE